MTDGPRYGRSRPARPWGPIPSSAAVVLGWWLVAHSSGQGWVQDLGDVVAAAVLVGLVGPYLALRRIRVEVVDAPTDGNAGLPVTLWIRTSRPARVTPVRPAGPAAAGEELVLLAEGRGLFASLTLDVATAAPFGLQWWTRRVELALPNPLYIAPRKGPAAPLDPLLHGPGAGREGTARRAGPDGDMRTPRPYRAGDARRLVHWPASAHTGELMVRELDRPLGHPAELVVSLPPEPAAAEAEAERAFATMLALLDRDVAVLLTTSEADGPRTAVVRDRREAARRMAAAV